MRVADLLLAGAKWRLPGQLARASRWRCGAHSMLAGAASSDEVGRGSIFVVVQAEPSERREDGGCRLAAKRHGVCRKTSGGCLLK